MIRGAILDLGSTLIYSENDHNWGALLPRMRADLLAHLRTAGYDLDAQRFLNLFSAKYQEYDAQRQTDWVEYTTGWILTSTLTELGSPAPPPALLQAAVRAYYAYSESLWHPMPAVYATLETLRAGGLKLGLLSNAADDGNVQRLIDNAGLRRYFHPIVVSAAVGMRKPNPRIFQAVLEQWPLPPPEVVMIGDTLGADILGAQLAGLHNIWLTSHAGHPANQAHRGNIIPEAEAATLAEVPAQIARLNDASPARSDGPGH